MQKANDKDSLIRDSAAVESRTSEQDELEHQFQNDLVILQAVISGLERLENQWAAAREDFSAPSRGYFTPDEDDAVRQMLLSYRNYRLALYEIIARAYSYRDLAESELRNRAFLTGFAAGLTLYSKSLKLISAYENIPLVRAKLNEPDSKWDLTEGFFEELLHAYSSPANYRDIMRGNAFWRAHRRELQAFAQTHPDWKWLIDLPIRERKIVRHRLFHVLLSRLRHDWRAFIRTVLLPFNRSRYGLQALVGTAGARLRTTTHYRPALKPSHITHLNQLLRPGDVLLVRAEKKLTGAILPGFWAHVILYVGRPEELEQRGLASHPHASRHWPRVRSCSRQHGCIIEGVSPAVQIETLARALFVDHVLVVRPRLDQGQITQALGEAFGHVGKPYDFEFDFNVTTRLVCTEIIYRCYHNRGPIAFTLVKRLGRYTLSGDDIANHLVETCKPDSQNAPFDLIALALSNASGEIHFHQESEILPALQRIQSGWKPASETGSLWK